MISKIYIALSIFLSCSVIADEFNVSTGEIIGRNIYGLAMDFQNDPVMLNTKPLIYKDVSFSESINLEEKRFTVSSFKNTIGNVYLTRYREDNLTPLDTYSVDLSTVSGLASPGMAIPTPWNSLLIAEKFTYNSKDTESFIEEFKPYYKNNSDQINHYNYGYVVEFILLNDQGDSKLIKNYAAGRVSPSSIALMPDNRTLYIHDNQQSGHLYVFVSDTENSFTKGSLYALSKNNSSLQSVKLGESSALKMKFRLKKASFDNIFNYQAPSSGNCQNGLQLVTTVYGDECLSIKKRYINEAGLLEPIRVAALNGVKPVGKGINEMRFDNDNNTLELVSESQSARYLLGRNEQLNSDYIIQR